MVLELNSNNYLNVFRLLGIMENHRRVWPLSNKPGGLEESIKSLQRVFEEIVPSATLAV